MLDGLTPNYRQQNNQIKKNNCKHCSYSGMPSLDGIVVDNQQPLSPKNNRRWPKINWRFSSILAVILVIAITSIITVFANNKTDFVKNKVDLIGLLRSGKYLIVFQNNAEQRATGGFIGSFATVDIEFGKVKNFSINSNIYKVDHRYDYALKQLAPQPLGNWLGDEYWAMRDSNWEIDYPSSAKQIAWFYEHEGGEPVDGVIAINATNVQDLLKIIGPINLPDYNLVVDDNNFFDVLHQEIEKDYFEREGNKDINEPKTILRDLYTQLLVKLTQYKNKKELIDLVLNQLDQKDNLIYFSNPDLEKIILAKNWGGEVKKTNSDYLYVNNSNLGGMKSSLNVAQEIKFESIIDNNQEITDKLTIIRTHTGSGQWPDGDNINYIRILTPPGSQLISAEFDKNNVLSDITVGQEADKNCYGFWFNTPVGQTKILTLEYSPGVQLNSINSYQLYLQKQPGEKNTSAQVIINNMVKFQDQINKDNLIK